MLEFELKHPDVGQDCLGFIPLFLSPTDSRKAAEQINENYQHGGGWRHQGGFTALPDGSLQYGDPTSEDADEPLVLLAEAKLGDETLRFYDCSYLAIFQPDGSFEVSRLD